MRTTAGKTHCPSRPAALRASYPTPQRLPVVARRHRDVIGLIERALDLQPPKERRRLERRASPAFEDPPRRTESMAPGEISERRSRFWQEEARAAACASLSDAIRFDQDRLEARDGARVCGRAAGQPAADDRDVGRMLTAKP